VKKKKMHPGSKTTPEQRAEIIRRYHAGETNTVLRAEFNLSEGHIRKMTGPRRVQVRREKKEIGLPLTVLKARAELQATALELRRALPTVNLLRRAILAANPDGSKCSVKACAFPALVNGKCRQHFADMHLAYSLNPSTHGIMVQEINIRTAGEMSCR
jgi:hypothetical protein